MQLNMTGKECKWESATKPQSMPNALYQSSKAVQMILLFLNNLESIILLVAAKRIKPKAHTSLPFIFIV